MCADAIAQPDSLMLEQWASWVLGEIWKRRYRVRRAPGEDPMHAAGRAIVTSLGEVGGTEGRTALLALGRLARGELSRLALRAAGELVEEVPELVSSVGTTRIVRAFSDARPDMGEALFLDAEPTADVPHMIGVFIDAAYGGAAKRFHLVRPTEPPTASDPDSGLDFKPVDSVLACQRVRAAIELTDRLFDWPITEEFVRYRGLVLARVQPLRVVGEI